MSEWVSEWVSIPGIVEDTAAWVVTGFFIDGGGRLGGGISFTSEPVFLHSSSTDWEEVGGEGSFDDFSSLPLVYKEKLAITLHDYVNSYIIYQYTRVHIKLYSHSLLQWTLISLIKKP